MATAGRVVDRETTTHHGIWHRSQRSLRKRSGVSLEGPDGAARGAELIAGHDAVEDDLARREVGESRLDGDGIATGRHGSGGFFELQRLLGPVLEPDRGGGSE